jgi:hypothetical protein
MPNLRIEFFKFGTTQQLQVHAHNTTGEWKFPECSGLPRVPNIGHSGKKLFPECCTRLIVHGTRGREALREDHLHREQNSGKRGTREQKTMWGNKDIFKTLFPECLTLALGEANLFPECLTLELGEEFFLFFVFLPHFFEAIPHYLKLLGQIWGYFEFFWYISLVFSILLNFLAYFKLELQVHEVMKFLNSKNDIYYIWCMLKLYLGSHMKFRTYFCRNMTNN